MQQTNQTLQRRLIYGAVVMLPTLVSCAVETPIADAIHGRQTGTIQSPEITEASGIVASRRYPDVLWVHNDSGDKPVLYALNPRGQSLGRFDVTGARARDWEDIALGPGPEPDQDYLYIGDIGDNRAKRDFITVYRVPEPAVRQSGPPIAGRTAPAQAIHLVFPDRARDAEALLIDPLNGDLYIITKREFFISRVYRANYPQAVDEQTILKQVGLVPWGLAVAGDISPDGQWIIVRGMGNTGLFQRPAQGALAQAFKGRMIPLPQGQQGQVEAICFDAQAKGYYTTCEGRDAPIFYYPLPQLPQDGPTAHWPDSKEKP